MTTTIFQIEGMSCNHCIMHVNRSINALEPVNVKVEIGKAVVTFDNSVLQESEIINAIETEGYKVINLKEV